MPEEHLYNSCSQISEEKNSIAIGGGAAGVYGRRLGRASVTRKPAPKPATKAIEKNKEGYTAEAAPEEAVEELAEVEVELEISASRHLTVGQIMAT